LGSLNCQSYDCFNEEYEFAKTFEIPPFRATLLKPRPCISGFFCVHLLIKPEILLLPGKRYAKLHVHTTKSIGNKTA
jgi:hypothetical protein